MEHNEQREYDALTELANIIKADLSFAEVLKKYFGDKEAEQITQWAQEW